MKGAKKLNQKNTAFIFFFISLSLCGCAQDMRGLENNLSEIRAAETEKVEGRSSSERAENVKENIMKIQELDGASVVIEGRTALIGLRIKEDNTKDIERIKKEASRLAKEADTNITSTSITSNKEITTMIEEMERERI